MNCSPDKPWGKDIRVYDVRLGNDVEATIDFSSNPPPLGVKWGYGPSFEKIEAVLPVPGEEGRYSTEVLVSCYAAAVLPV